MNFKSGLGLILSMFFAVVSVGVLTMYTDGEISNLILAIMIFVLTFLLAPYSFGVMMYEKINYGLTNYFKLLGSWLGILVFAYAVLWVVGWLQVHL